jgi:hypothetical protein
MSVATSLIGKHFHIHYMGTEAVPPVIMNHRILEVEVDKGMCFVALLRQGDDPTYTGYRAMPLHEVIANMLHDSAEAMVRYCVHVHANVLEYEENGPTEVPPKPKKNFLN